MRGMTRSETMMPGRKVVMRLQRFLAVGGGIGDVAPRAHQLRQPERVARSSSTTSTRSESDGGSPLGDAADSSSSMSVGLCEGSVRCLALDSSVKKEVVATARPCNFWQHSIRQYIFYMQIGTTTRNSAHGRPGRGSIPANAGKFRAHEYGAALATGAAGGLPLLRRPDPAPRRRRCWPWRASGPVADGQLTAAAPGLRSPASTPCSSSALVLSLLVLGGESPRRVLLGTRPIARRGPARLRAAAVGVPAVRRHRRSRIARWAPCLLTPQPVRDAGVDARRSRPRSAPSRSSPAACARRSSARSSCTASSSASAAPSSASSASACCSASATTCRAGAR